MKIAIQDSLQETVKAAVDFLPLLVGAVIVFIFGWIIAAAFGKMIEQIVKALKVDHLFERLELDRPFKRIEYDFKVSRFIGGLVKWFIIIWFLLAAANILRLEEVSRFLNEILFYMPNVLVAAIILVIAVFIADILEHAVRVSVRVLGYKDAVFGLIVRWSIWIFALIAAVDQLKIEASDLFKQMVVILFASVGLALGLAFGLGGKEIAAELLRKARDKM